MALARPVRALGIAAALLWIFFLYKIFMPSSPLVRPGNLPSDERDPNLDRECGPCLCLPLIETTGR